MDNNHPFSDIIPEYDGVIGWNLLKNFNLLFDGESHSLTLFKPEYFPENLDLWSRSKMNRDTTPSFRCSLVNGEELNLILETGAGLRSPETGKVWNIFFYEKRDALGSLSPDIVFDEELDKYTVRTDLFPDDSSRFALDF